MNYKNNTIKITEAKKGHIRRYKQSSNMIGLY